MQKITNSRVGKRKILGECELKETRLPERGKPFGRVIKPLESDQALVRRTDDVTRRGKLKQRIWIRDNCIAVIAPWDSDDAKCGDDARRSAPPRAGWSKNNDHLPGNSNDKKSILPSLLLLKP